MRGFFYSAVLFSQDLLNNYIMTECVTCAEQQQDLHAQKFIMRDLQTNKLAGNLQHLLKLVRHEGKLHPVPTKNITSVGLKIT